MNNEHRTMLYIYLYIMELGRTVTPICTFSISYKYVFFNKKTVLYREVYFNLKPSVPVEQVGISASSCFVSSKLC